MGTTPRKFHITDEGIIYKINDAGEITELGNVESLADSSAPKTSATASPKHPPADMEIRYTLPEMEERLCNGKGNGLNRHERKLLASESKNIPALMQFVGFCGCKWTNVLIARFEQGDTYLEPVLAKVSLSASGSLERLATCKRAYSTQAIYQNLYNHDITIIRNALKANPNSPYYDAGFVPPSPNDGCFGVILLFIISTATIITTLL